jgi:hypothetical protein
MQVDAPPPAIIAVFDDSGPAGTSFAVSSTSPAAGGDVVTLIVLNLAGAASLPPASSVWINSGTAVVNPLSLVAIDANTSRVQFVLPASVAADPDVTSQTVPIALGAGTRLSPAYKLNIVVPPPPAPAGN